jgi:hypothetical protein
MASITASATFGRLASPNNIIFGINTFAKTGAEVGRLKTV